MEVKLKYIDVDAANIRPGPGLKYPPRYTLPYNTDITVRYPTTRADGYDWAERNKYPGLWVANQLLRDPTGKIFGVHWSQSDNGEMLALISECAAAGRPIPWITLLVGIVNVPIAEIQHRSPTTQIYARMWYPWAGDPKKDYEPPGGWNGPNVTYEEGLRFGRWYVDLVRRTNNQAFILKGHNVWHIGFNEPSLGDDLDGRRFLRWHNGYLDAMLEANLWTTGFNFPPGYPGLPREESAGNLFWVNPDTHRFIDRLVSSGGLFNNHEGDALNKGNWDGLWDSQRDVKIRPWLPSNLRNIPFVCSEYGLAELRDMSAEEWAYHLAKGQGAMADHNIRPCIWVYRATDGFEGQDWYNKRATYRSYMLTG